MDLRQVLATNFNLQNLLFKGIAVVFIAITFEVAVWWFGRLIEKWTAPLLTQDNGREQNWRVRRRATLRQTPRIIARGVCYAIALILVFDVFGTPVLPLSLSVGAAVALFGAALLPTMRDAAQGYTLLAEDALAIGDVVEIGAHQGTVEKFTLRGTWLRDAQGHARYLSNSDIKNVVVLKRKTEDPNAAPSKDPNALPPRKR